MTILQVSKGKNDFKKQQQQQLFSVSNKSMIECDDWG